MHARLQDRKLQSYNFMNRLISTLFFALLLSTYTKAQTNDSIIGKWKFQELYNTNGMDSTGVSMLKKMFSEMTIYLKGNNHYKSELMTRDEGTYEYEKTSKKLTLISNKGTKSELELSVLTNETLLLSFGKGKSIILRKTIASPDDEKETAPQKLELVSITTAQLCKKWFLNKRYLPNRTEEQLKTVTELFKGTYFDFKSDNTYTVKIGQITEAGKWNLSNENKTLNLTANGETKIWNIKKISENEIQMIRGNTEEFWTFSTKE